MSLPQNLSVGFSQTDITPQGPVALAGYYYERFSEGVHDPLMARAMAISDGKESAVLCMLDLCLLDETVVDEIRAAIAERGGPDANHLIIAVVHTHTSPDIRRETEYRATLRGLVADTVMAALANACPTPLRVAHGKEATLQFIRRYRMKDGSTCTNPDISNPDIVGPIGTPDREVLTILAGKLDAPEGGVVNFALHCDTVGGTELSADWTYFLRETLREKFGAQLALLTPIGCCGDVNHWDILNKIRGRGAEEAKRIGDTLAQAVLKSLASTVEVKPGAVKALRKIIDVELPMPTPEELKAAEELVATPAPQGEDFSIPRVQAARKIKINRMGPVRPLEISVVAFGDAALIALPAECFSELGRSIKRQSPFAHNVIITLAGKYTGYIGERRNFEEGGYEMLSTVLPPGTGERIVETAVSLLKTVHD